MSETPLVPSEYQQHWSMEVHDDEWTSNLENYIYAMLELDELETDLIHGVDCRETLCRLELNVAGNANILMRLQQDLTDQFSFRLGPTETSATVVVFLARDDHPELFGRSDDE